MIENPVGFFQFCAELDVRGYEIVNRTRLLISRARGRNPSYEQLLVYFNYHTGVLVQVASKRAEVDPVRSGFHYCWKRGGCDPEFAEKERILGPFGKWHGRNSAFYVGFYSVAHPHMCATMDHMSIFGELQAEWPVPPKLELLHEADFSCYGILGPHPTVEERTALVVERIMMLPREIRESLHLVRRS